MEKERRILEQELNQAYMNKNHKKGKETALKLEKLTKNIDTLYAEWEGMN